MYMQLIQLVEMKQCGMGNKCLVQYVSPQNIVDYLKKIYKNKIKINIIIKWELFRKV